MRKKPWLMTAAVLLGVLAAGVGWLYLETSPSVHDLPELQGALSQHHLVHEGRERSYLVYTPPGLQQTAPVLFVFHGSMLSGEAMRRYSARQFDRVADAEGFLVVYPDGVDRHWNGCRGTADYTANTENVDDVGFVRAMLDALSERTPVDRQRVFATGFSNGGHMALRLALEAPELVRAVASMAASLPSPDYLDCEKSGQAVSIAIVNGTEDPINPYQGGLVKLLWNDSRGRVESSRATARYFAGLAGYPGEGELTPLPNTAADDGSHIELRRWHGRDKEVRLYTVVGGGHTFPSQHVRFGSALGNTNADIEIADELWAFFRRQ